MSLLVETLENCPGRLSAQQVAQFRREGYLAFGGVLSPEEVQGAKASLTVLVDGLRANHRALRGAGGEMWRATESSLKIQFEPAVRPEGPDDPELELKVRKFHEFVGVDEQLTFLARAQANIQGVLAGLIGADPILLQDMALVKPPFHGSAKPWHQDDAYFKIAPLEAVCGVWIALDEAGADNGCMFVLPGAHKVGALRHYHGTDCEIVPDRLCGWLHPSGAVPVPLPPGGAIFFSGILPHFTPPNGTDKRRRALQFHYRSQDSRVVEDAEYNHIFVESDGSPASCSAAAKRGF